jgi:O-antigen/teichoic acid export membrane protein
MTTEPPAAPTRSRNPLPEGTLAVGAGLLVAGITAYLFQIFVAREVGKVQFAAFTALWLSAFSIGPGFFLPLEQEVGRALAARHARGLGGGPVIKRAALAGAVLAVILVAGALAAAAPLERELFDHDGLLLVGLILTIVGYFAAHLTRGALSGNGRFVAYGTLVGAEGSVRLLGCIALLILGAHTAGPFGVFVGIAPIFAVGLVLSRERGLLTPGPDAPWSELSSALGYLLLGAVMAQILVNAAPLTAKVLAHGRAQNEIVGRFAAGFIIARVPVFLFQAVQAALLPKLAGLAGARRHADFRTLLMRLVIAVGSVAVIGTVGGLTLGPSALHLLFGSKYTLSRTDLGYLAGANGAFMLGLTLAQALIALGGHARAAAGWVLGIVAFVVVTALGSSLLTRVEQGFLAGTLTAVVVMGVLIIDLLRRPHTEDVAAFVDAVEHEYVEP